MTTLATPPKLQFFDANGNPLAGGKLYTYAAGTTTPLATYTDYGGGTANPNPVILDSRGEANVWLGTALYKFKLTTSTNVDVWTVDNVGGAATLAALAASGGSALVGYLPAGTGAVATTVQTKLRESVSVKDFGASPSASATTNYNAIQAALTYINSVGGGTVRLNAGTYDINAPLTMYRNTRFIGDGKGVSIIRKTTGTTVATSLTSNLVCLDNTPIGANANCILYVYDAIRALDVEIAHITFTTTGTNATGSPVKYGIVAVGMSESSIHDITVNYVSSASFVTPVIFLSEVYNMTTFQCGQGFSTENSTSLSFHSNYSSRCQRYGYFFRDVKYSSIKSNACDSLNDVSLCPDYTDRTVDSICYMFSACYALDVSANGSEGCFGTQYKLYACIATTVENNTIIGPASSYTGANQVALFYVDSTANGVCIKDNFVLNSVTPIQGGAVPSQHHDFYSNAASNLGFKYINNWMSTTKYGTPSAVYGNTVPAYVNSIYQGAQVHGEFTPSMNLVNATGVTLTYGASNKGRYSIVNGWMFVDITVHLATTAFTGGAPVYPQIDGLPIANKAASQAPLLIDYTSNVTWASTEPYYFQIDPAFKNGLARNRTQSVALGAGTLAFASGTANVIFHCTGQVYVGDQVNIV